MLGPGLEVQDLNCHHSVVRCESDCDAVFAGRKSHGRRAKEGICNHKLQPVQNRSPPHPFLSPLTLTPSCRVLRSPDPRRFTFPRPLEDELEVRCVTHL